MEPTEADSEIEEEHLLNFVVNSLDEEVAIDLGEDVKITTETLYEVLAGAGAGEDLSQLRLRDNRRLTTRQHRPEHLTEQFELDSVEAVGDTLLQRDALATLPD